MRILMVSALALSLGGCATAYSLQPAATGSQQVTYDHGTAILMSKKEHGAVRVAPTSTEFSGRMGIAVVAFNNGGSQANLGPENVHVYTAAGLPIQVFTYEQLAREAKKAAAWQTFAVALSGAANAYSASQPTTVNTNGSVYGNRGYAHYTSTSTIYDPASAAVANSMNQANTNAQLSHISATLDATLAGLGSSMLRTTTVEPGSAFGGNIVVDRPRFGKGEAQTLRVVVDFAGEDHEFGFTVGGK